MNLRGAPSTTKVDNNQTMDIAEDDHRRQWKLTPSGQLHQQSSSKDKNQNQPKIYHLQFIVH